jgi:hypothetical protein
MSTFLKLFPGDKDFREVSEKEWNAPYEPFGDKGGYGNILGLTADCRVFDRPGGKLLLARKWPSRSFTMNFARLMSSLFSAAQSTLVDTAQNNIDVTMGGSTVFQAGQAGLLMRRSEIIGSGAGMAIGDGSGTEDHTREELYQRVGNIAVANGSVALTAQTTATFTFSITHGITIAVAGTTTVREIGLYLFLRRKVSPGHDPTGDEGTPFLVAYDQVTPTPVAQGGVFAPRYTLNFPV